MNPVAPATATLRSPPGARSAPTRTRPVRRAGLAARPQGAAAASPDPPPHLQTPLAASRMAAASRRTLHWLRPQELRLPPRPPPRFGAQVSLLLGGTGADLSDTCPPRAALRPRRSPLGSRSACPTRRY